MWAYEDDRMGGGESHWESLQFKGPFPSHGIYSIFVVFFVYM
jgi:hypothetical protein